MDDELYDQYPLADQEEIERSRRAFKTWKALQLGAKRWAGFVRRTILFSGVCHEREVIAVYADRFLLTRELGEGGMAVVYEAVEDGDGLNKAFALKIIKPEFHAYFESELDSLRRLQAVDSEHVVKIEAVYPDFHCIRMQRLEGMSLRQRLQDCGRIISPLEVAAIGRQVALALAAVHSKGVYHRDIKPENIFLAQTHDWHKVVLLDFGIAISDETNQTVLAGTSAYAPPERDSQRTNPQSRRSNDLYMLGRVIFEMLTGGRYVTDIKNYVTPCDLVRDFAHVLFHQDPGLRPHSAQEVADGLLKLAREELSKQLPAFLSRSLKTVQAIALQVLEARKDGREYRRPTVNNIRYIDEEQVKLLEPVAGAQAGKRAEVDDVFDLGQSLYALVAGSPPPPGITHAEFAEKSGLDLPPAFLRTFANLCAERSELRLKSVSEVCDRLQELKHHAPAIQ